MTSKFEQRSRLSYGGIKLSKIDDLEIKTAEKKQAESLNTPSISDLMKTAATSNFQKIPNSNLESGLIDEATTLKKEEIAKRLSIDAKSRIDFNNSLNRNNRKDDSNLKNSKNIS